MNSSYKKHIKKISETIKNNNCAFFIGAGISAYCDLPSGKELSKDLAAQMDIEYDNQPLTEMAEYYEVEFGRPELINFLKKKILIDVPEEKRRCYDIIGKIDIRIIITTNYDNLLKDSNQSYNIIRRNADIWTMNENIGNIIKIHGDLEFQDEVIITDSDFYNYSDAYPNISSFLEYIFSIKSIVFLGFGLRDKNTNDILFWSNRTMGKGKRKSYAIFKSINKYFKKILENRNIIVLEMDAYNFLNELAKELAIEIDEKIPLEFEPHFSKDIINLGDMTKIIFEFKNNTSDVIKFKSYQFEGYYEGNPIVKYYKHSYEDTIKANKPFKREYGLKDPFKAYFGGVMKKGVFEAKIYIEYQIGDEKNIKTTVNKAVLIVE